MCGGPHQATFLVASHPRITPGAGTRWGRARRMARSGWLPTLDSMPTSRRTAALADAGRAVPVRPRGALLADAAEPLLAHGARPGRFRARALSARPRPPPGGRRARGS